MPSPRARQTCSACTRRKVRCSKTVPCTNCIRRDEIDLCTVDASPGHVAQDGDHQEELHMLRRRVAELEARLMSLDHRQPSVEQQETLTRRRPSAESNSTMTATSQCVDGRRSQTPRAAGQRAEAHPETGGRDEQQRQDAVIEDAASILEFLAWGRRKDVAAADCGFDGADTPAGPFLPDSLGDMSQLAVLQMLVPDGRTLWRLVDYHVDSLLWFHTSFHAPTFCRQLERFLGRHGGRVEAPGVDLLWVALLFAVLAGSITCAPDRVVREDWAIGDEERAVLSRRWFRAVVACLNRAEYTANLSMVSVQAICTLTISAHLLGFSNTQSIHLAAAVRIAQSLGLHRSGGGGGTGTGTGMGSSSPVEVETGRRVWLQLCCQDWFGIPFSESCLIHPLHSQAPAPANCHDEGAGALQPLPDDVPTVTSYCRFLAAIAAIMPQLQDGLLSRSTPLTRYEQVLASDRRMRALATAGRPAFLSSTPLDPAWPAWVPWARRSLAVSSAHKIIMIHRAFLSESLTNPAYAFTRRTCLAAAKTIIKEYRCVVAADDDLHGRGAGPVLWVHQAFSVAAAIILILDVLHRRPAEPEYAPHLQLAEEAVDILRRCPTSLIAVRGVKLLSALLLEVRQDRQPAKRQASDMSGTYEDSDDAGPSGFARPAKKSRGLDIPSFVQSFCGSLGRNSASERAIPASQAARREHGLHTSRTANEDESPVFSMHEGPATEGPASGSDDLDTGEQDRPLLLQSSIDNSSTFGNLLYLANYGFPVT